MTQDRVSSRTATGYAGAEEERRRRGFEAVSALSKSAARPALAVRGISEVRLIAQWREIVGERIARIAQPLRIKSPRGGFAVGGVLVVAVSGAHASEVEHSGPQILERVNAFYGYAAVANLQLTQSRRPIAALSARSKPTPPPLSSEQRAELSELTDPIENSALRGALSRLGANIMRRPPKAETARDAAAAPAPNAKL